MTLWWWCAEQNPNISFEMLSLGILSVGIYSYHQYYYHLHHSRLIRKGVNQFTCYLNRCNPITPYLKRCEHIHILSKKVWFTPFTSSLNTQDDEDEEDDDDYEDDDIIIISISSVIVITLKAYFCKFAVLEGKTSPLSVPSLFCASGIPAMRFKEKLLFNSTYD